MQCSWNIVSSIRKYDHDGPTKRICEYAKILTSNTSATFDVFDAIGCFRDGASCNARTTSNFIVRCVRCGQIVRSRINEWCEKKFRKGRGEENVAKMPSAKRISKWKRILCPLHHRLCECLRSSKQQFDIASSNPGCRLLNVGVCKKNWICKFFREMRFCRLKRRAKDLADRTLLR